MYTVYILLLLKVCHIPFGIQAVPSCLYAEEQAHTSGSGPVSQTSWFAESQPVSPFAEQSAPIAKVCKLNFYFFITVKLYLASEISNQMSHEFQKLV